MHFWATFSHTLSFLLALSGWNQTPFLFNPFKFRVWCRFLIEVITFLMTVLVTSSWVLWFYVIGNTLNWKNPRTLQLSCSLSLLPEFVISFSPGYLVVWSSDLTSMPASSWHFQTFHGFSNCITSSIHLLHVSGRALRALAPHWFPVSGKILTKFHISLFHWQLQINAPIFICSLGSIMQQFLFCSICKYPDFLLFPQKVSRVSKERQHILLD